MTQAIFKTEPSGVSVATIISTADEGLEVLRASDGSFRLIIHTRDSRTGAWEDLSVTLKLHDFAVLGSIATGDTL